ncbi:uncharacterized protein LOC143450551 [Clavelina lepadiformis]|uniref:uncharacterized protein LOC143450551 n=1 Tax=Clavelina lepadiformis TaxID=159417 RepID=UPI0040423012
MNINVLLCLCALAVFKTGAINVPVKSFGCWRDTSNRAIPTVEGSSSLLDGAYQSRSNALQKCARVALERGYKIFAVQNGGWCATSATARQTYMKYGTSNKCKADGEGGPWANHVYEVQSTGFVEKKDLGCWRDTSNRAIPTVEGTSSLLDGSYTARSDALRKCARVTFNRGNDIFALQNGGWCATSGNAHLTYKKYGGSSQCQSDGEGGPWGNAVYEFISYFEYQSRGCWRDTSSRAIPTVEGSSPILDGAYQHRHNALEKCARVAEYRDYKFFAVQNGGWCATSHSAGSTYRKYGRSNACKTDGEGGPWANHVYEIILKFSKFSFISRGCWRDTSNRAVPPAEGTDLLDGPYNTRLNARLKCARVAKAKGHNVFALQNGGWCATAKGGVGYKKYGPASNCNQNGLGGPWANNVYTF